MFEYCLPMMKDWKHVYMITIHLNVAISSDISVSHTDFDCDINHDFDLHLKMMNIFHNYCILRDM